MVAQDLEYASYVATWSVQDIERVARDYWARRRNVTIGPFDEWLVERFQLPSAADLQAALQKCLQEGRLRVVVAVDGIPQPLLSLVTFLNAHATFELLLLQVTSYPTPDGRRVVVPSIHGFTPKTRPVAPEQPWVLNHETMVETARQLRPLAAEAVGQLYDLGERYGLRASGGRNPGFRVGVTTPAGWVSLFGVYPADRVYFDSSRLGAILGAEARRAYVSDLVRIYGDALKGVDNPSGWHSITFEEAAAHIDELVPLLESIARQLTDAPVEMGRTAVAASEGSLADTAGPEVSQG